LSSSCQLKLGVDLSHHSLRSYIRQEQSLNLTILNQQGCTLLTKVESWESKVSLPLNYSVKWGIYKHNDSDYTMNL